MNDKYQITSDGTIFEVLSDGSIKKLGHIASDGSIHSLRTSPTPSSSSNHSSIAKFFAWIFGIALFVAIIICVNFNTKIENYKSRNYDLQLQVDNLQSDNGTLNSNVQELQSQINNLQSQNTSLKENQPLQITNLQVGVTDYNGTVIVDYGNTIYSSLTRYLKPRITVYSYSTKTVMFYIKLYTPSGLSTGTSSPSGYSYTSEKTVSSGSNTLELGGWGNNSPGHWDRGNYRYEIWCNEICLKQQSFTIF